MTIKVGSSKTRDLEQWIATNSIAHTDMKYDTLRWSFRGKELKDVNNIIDGKPYSCDTVFNIDIDYLQYNFSNRRIAIYLKEREIKKKTNRDGFSYNTVSKDHKEDIDWMQRLLLGRETLYGIQSNAPGFTEELITRGQIEPAIITIDGTLRNGNRRKAIFHDILSKISAKVKDKEQDYSKLNRNDFKYLKVIILPRDTTEEELFDLENFLQTKQDWKQPYDAISILNIIKEAKDKFGMDFEEIKEKYLHDASISDIENDYWKIKKMDEYLIAKGAAGQYGTIRNQQEMFQDNVSYKFAETGLAGIPREEQKRRDRIIRKRNELFFDMVSTNACNNDVLKVSDKAVRRLVTEIFKVHTSDPEAIVDGFYAGINRDKLRQCEPNYIAKFAAKIENQISSYEQRNIDRAPMQKLKKITKDLRSFKPSDVKSLCDKKKDTNNQMALLKNAVSDLEKDIAN